MRKNISNILKKKKFTNQSIDQMFDTITIPSLVWQKASLYAKLICEVAGRDLECGGTLVTPVQRTDGIPTDIHYSYNQTVEYLNDFLSVSGAPETKNQNFKAIGMWHSHSDVKTHPSPDDNATLKEETNNLLNRNIFRLYDEKIQHRAFVKNSDGNIKLQLQDNFGTEIILPDTSLASIPDEPITIETKAAKGVSFFYSLVINKFTFDKIEPKPLEDYHIYVALEDFENPGNILPFEKRFRTVNIADMDVDCRIDLDEMVNDILDNTITNERPLRETVPKQFVVPSELRKRYTEKQIEPSIQPEEQPQNILLRTLYNKAQSASDMSHLIDRCMKYIRNKSIPNDITEKLQQLPYFRDLQKQKEQFKDIIYDIDKADIDKSEIADIKPRPGIESYIKEHKKRQDAPSDESQYSNQQEKDIQELPIQETQIQETQEQTPQDSYIKPEETPKEEITPETPIEETIEQNPKDSYVNPIQEPQIQDTYKPTEEIPEETPIQETKIQDSYVNPEIQVEETIEQQNPKDSYIKPETPIEEPIEQTPQDSYANHSQYYKGLERLKDQGIITDDIWPEYEQPYQEQSSQTQDEIPHQEELEEIIGEDFDMRFIEELNQGLKRSYSRMYCEQLLDQIDEYILHIQETDREIGEIANNIKQRQKDIADKHTKLYERVKSLESYLT
ncbi:MAG: hypothetical protein R6V53_05795 [Candidatus Woesearchaeota archaeon]